MNAMAYTSGNDLVFGAGQFNPDFDAGRALLAHELAHVAQQDGASGDGRRPLARFDARGERSPNAGCWL